MIYLTNIQAQILQCSILSTSKTITVFVKQSSCFNLQNTKRKGKQKINKSKDSLEVLADQLAPECQQGLEAPVRKGGKRQKFRHDQSCQPYDAPSIGMLGHHTHCFSFVPLTAFLSRSSLFSLWTQTTHHCRANTLWIIISVSQLHGGYLIPIISWKAYRARSSGQPYWSLIPILT